MAKANITLYKDCKIKKGKNWCVDDVDSYLQTLSDSLTFTDIQYQRFDLEIKIVLNLNQDLQTKAISVNRYSYAKIYTTIQNEIVNYYYFITKIEQLAPSAIQLTLYMDALNTFKYVKDDGTNFNNARYTLSSETLVTREHKDRVTPISSTISMAPTTAREKTLAQDLYDGGAIMEDTPIYYIDLGQILPTLQGDDIGMYYEADGEPGIMVYVNGALTAAAHSMTIGPTNIYFGDENGDDVYIIEFYNWPSGNKLGIKGIGAQDSVDFQYLGNASKWVAAIPYMSAQKFTSATVTEVIRKIDMFDEQINPILFKTSDQTLYDADTTATWYLTYASSLGVSSQVDYESKYVNPVNVLLFSTEGYNITTTVPAPVWFGPQNEQIPDVNNTREYLKFKKSDFEDDNAYIQVGNNKYYRTGLSGQQVYYIERKNNNDIIFTKLYKGIIGSVTELASNFSEAAVFGINSCQMQKCLDIANVFSVAEAIGTFYFGSGSSTFTASGGKWEDLNLTNPQLIKAINLPFAPIAWLEAKRDITTYPNYLEWDTTFNCFKLQNPQQEFKRTIDFFSINPFNQLHIPSISPGFHKPRDESLESKLYNSSFSYYKFVYDSYSFPFQLELVNAARYISLYGVSSPLKVDYVVSNNITSKFYFGFPQFLCDYAPQDYENIMIVERNNEKALYNNAFINYIKSGGYNHDQAKAQKQNVVNGVTTALSLAGAIASFATAGYTGGAGIAAGIALAGSAITGVMRTVNSAQEQDQAMAQKLNQNAMQGTSVLGGSDISLFTAYSGNKPKMVKYDLSATMKKAIWDLFHYCGYATREQKEPNVYTRIYFNFIQAEIVFKQYNFNENIAEEIRKKWKEGVTFFHNYHNGGYDFNQQYENFETLLMPL